MKRFIKWRLKHISDRNFLVILAVLCGFASGLVAVIIKNLVFFIEHLVSFSDRESGINYLYFIYPVIGIFLVLLLKKFLIKQDINFGIPGVLRAISKKSGFMPVKSIYSSALASSITLGFGGSVGMEGPSVNAGGAVGSNLGRFFGLHYKQLVLLIACGSAGAISALFKAPITGVVLALEILMIDLSMTSLVPILVASVTGTITSYFFLGQNTIYHISNPQFLSFSDIPFFALLGLLCGLVSVYFTKVLMLSEKIFGKIKNSYTRYIIGAILTGILIMLIPALYGEGYDVINLCIEGKSDFVFQNSIFSDFSSSIPWMLVFLFIIIILKAIATSLTLGAGGVGGIFGPTLFLGATTGLLFASLNDFLKIQTLSRSNYALAGMGGLIAGVMHAPLTGIFLIVEITAGYHMIVPLIVTVSLSYLTNKYFVPYSVDAIQLAEKGELISHNKDKSVLSLMKIEKLIETNFHTIQPDQTLGELVKVISVSSRNIFPVVDANKRFLGIVLLNDIRNIVFKPELYDTVTVHELMFLPSPVVDPDESMEDIAVKFEATENYNLPVVKNGIYLGFVSRANVFSEYRKMIKNFSNQ